MAATPPTNSDRITLIILGAGGDLTERLLLPGLGEVLTRTPELDVRLIGAARSEQDDWGGYVRDALVAADIDVEAPAVARMLHDTHYEPTDATDPAELEELLGPAGGRTVLYFALAQSITETVLDALSEVDLPERVHIALEKPFGTDQASAERLNRKVARLVGDDRVLRVDHFLAMAATRTLLGLRLAGRVIEPVLNRENVESIEVVFNETIGLEDRAEFYEDTGAIRDMLQSHLLQVMAVLMIPPPASLDDEEIPALVAHLLRHTRLAGDVADSVVAGRYTAGEVDGRSMPGYLDEDGTDPDGRVETYARLLLNVDTWRWGGVPVTLESGKAIGDPRQEVVVRFRPAPHRYPEFGEVTGDVLRLGFEDGRVGLELTGAPDDPEPNRLLLASPEHPSPLSAYGWVVHWLLTNNHTFSVAGRAAEEGWRIVQPALDAIASGAVPLRDYPAGRGSRSRPVDAATPRAGASSRPPSRGSRTTARTDAGPGSSR